MIPPSAPQPRRNIALGILLLAGGRAGGLAHFGNTPQAVLAALAPLTAMLVVALFLALAGGGATAMLTDLLCVAVGLLGPLVLSFEVARRWGRAEAWFRFATAFCWCQWAGPMALLGLLFIMAVMLAGGVPAETAEMIGLIGLIGYGLWLHWFLARHALDLSPGRALTLVVVVNVATSALIIVPQLAARLA
jgi:hypothetical protein